MDNEDEGARLTRREENRELIAKHRKEVGGSPAPRHRLEDLREWLMAKIDGGEETRGEDGLISDFIRQIDALDDQVRSLTRPKTITEWVAANRYVEPTPTPQSKTQQKRFAAQSEPRGCPTPGACSAVAEKTRLRQMAEHERDAMLEELIAARKVISEMTAGVETWAQAWKEQK